MPPTNRVPIGITSMVFYALKLEDAIPRAASMGFDAIEIWAEHLWRWGENPSRLAAVLSAQKMRCTMHCPIMDLNLTSPNPGIREESVRQTVQSVELTHDLGAELLIAHPGHLYSLKNPLDVYWQMQIDAFEKTMAAAERYTVRVAVENMDVQNPEEVVKGSAEICRLTEHFGRSKLGVVLDTTHLNTTEQNIRFIKNTENIVHTHLSDAEVTPLGTVNTHLPLGEGRLDFQAIFSALLPNYKGILSLETFIPQGYPPKVLAQREWLETALNS